MRDDQLITNFQTVEDNFNQALESNNTHSISKHISDDWILLEPQFGITSKEHFLNAIELGDLFHTTMKKKILRVQLYNDVAIVTARGMNIGYFKTNRFNSEQWVTNIYKKENDIWICIMTQEAPVTCK